MFTAYSDITFVTPDFNLFPKIIPFLRNLNFKFKNKVAHYYNKWGNSSHKWGNIGLTLPNLYIPAHLLDKKIELSLAA